MRNPLLCVAALAFTVPAVAASPVACGPDAPKVAVLSAAAGDEGVSLLVTFEDNSGAFRKIVLPAVVGAAGTVTLAEYPGFAVRLRATSGESSTTLLIATETWCRGVPIEEHVREVPLVRLV